MQEMFIKEIECNNVALEDSGLINREIHLDKVANNEFKSFLQVLCMVNGNKNDVIHLDKLSITFAKTREVKEQNKLVLSKYLNELLRLKKDKFEWIVQYKMQGNIIGLNLNNRVKNIKNNYVYALINDDTNEIFYIGRGVKQRLYAHERDKTSNKRKVELINQLGEAKIRYVILVDDLSFGESSSLEAFLINYLPNLVNEVKPLIEFDYINKLIVDNMRNG